MCSLNGNEAEGSKDKMVALVADGFILCGGFYGARAQGSSDRSGHA